MNNKYKVEITETLKRVVEIEANNEENALYEVTKKYKNSEIVLDYSDFVDVNFENI